MIFSRLRSVEKNEKWQRDSRENQQYTTVPAYAPAFVWLTPNAIHPLHIKLAEKGAQKTPTLPTITTATSHDIKPNIFAFLIILVQLILSSFSFGAFYFKLLTLLIIVVCDKKTSHFRSGKLQIFMVYLWIFLLKAKINQNDWRCVCCGRYGVSKWIVGIYLFVHCLTCVLAYL